MKNFSKAQKEKLIIYWEQAERAKYLYYNRLDKIEEEMKKNLNVPQLEFFWNDGSVQGIGNQYAEKKDKYNLLQSEDFRKIKVKK